MLAREWLAGQSPISASWMAAQITELWVREELQQISTAGRLARASSAISGPSWRICSTMICKGVSELQHDSPCVCGSRHRRGDRLALSATAPLTSPSLRVEHPWSSGTRRGAFPRVSRPQRRWGPGEERQRDRTVDGVETAHLSGRTVAFGGAGCQHPRMRDQVLARESEWRSALV